MGREEAVSTVLGTTLMVALTVSATAGLAFALGNIEAPLDVETADLVSEIDPGDGEWGTGDEALAVRHVGGQQLREADARIRVTVDGQTTLYRDLDGPGEDADAGCRPIAGGRECDLDFPGDILVFGGSWQARMAIDAADDVHVVVVSHGEQASQILSQAGLRALGNSCAGDTSGPTASMWSQSPADVQETTTGVVTVQVKITDDCSKASGMVLHHRVEDGADRAWNSTALTHIGANLYRAVIPDPGWSAHGGLELEYYAHGMADSRGNVADSAIQNDTIQVAGAGPGPGVFDPGFAYHDVNCDGLYVDGVDAGIPDHEVHDGAYDAHPDCLVLPPSVGRISTSGAPIDFRGRGVLVAVDLKANGRSIHVESTDASLPLVVQGILIDVNGNGPLRLLSGSDVILDSATVRTQQRPIEVRAGGFVSMEDAFVKSAQNQVIIEAASGIFGDRAAVESGGGSQLWMLSGSDIHLRDASLRLMGGGTGRADFSASGQTLFVQGATISIPSRPDVVLYAPPTSAVVGVPSQGVFVPG